MPFIGHFAYRELDFAKFVYCLKITAMISGAVLIIVGPAKGLRTPELDGSPDDDR